MEYLDKNPNIEMKRWYSFIESFTPKIIYNPGTTNVVATKHTAFR